MRDPRLMPVSPRLTFVLLSGLLAAPAFAADPPHEACLSKAEQRIALSSHRAISLAKAVKAARKHGRHGELLRARLCHRDERLVYELTMLAHNGKVKRMAVDAKNGELIKGR
jgi:uncharacterized membrane protein YkoI